MRHDADIAMREDAQSPAQAKYCAKFVQDESDLVFFKFSGAWVDRS
jgi:hypothetical protein